MYKYNQTYKYHKVRNKIVMPCYNVQRGAFPQLVAIAGSPTRDKQTYEDRRGTLE